MPWRRTRVKEMSPEEVLDNFTRGQVYGYICGKVVTHYNEIKNDLGLNNGSAGYHLYVLEKCRLVRSVKKGNRRYFYVGKLPDGFLADDSTETGKEIIEALKDAEELTNNQLAQRLGRPASTVSNNVKKLRTKGLVEAERRGMKVLLSYNSAAEYLASKE
jgi:predicted transcriptional regulator